MRGLALELQQATPMPLGAAFECAPGEVLALVGPSGSGKSTLLRCIAGSFRPGAGRITVDGRIWFDAALRVHLPPHRRSVGMVFQHYALFPHLNALGNVAAAMGHRPAGERANRAAALLERMHLGDLAARRPAELSGGQQQRVAVARALARDPAVLLLDEPFSAVDKLTRQHLYREIVELRRDLEMPVVLVTHDLDEAVMLADRLVVLNRGCTLQTGTPDDVTARPHSREVARLVGLRNVFDATVVEQWPGRETVLEWQGRRLSAAFDPRFAAGARVAFVVPDGYVIAQRRDRPARGAAENPLHGRVVSVLMLGPTAHLRFETDDPGVCLQFSVAAHVARRHGFTPGSPLAVSILAQGVHLMPPQ